MGDEHLRRHRQGPPSRGKRASNIAHGVFDVIGAATCSARCGSVSGSDEMPPGGAGNTRNGTSPKTLITEHGQVGIDAARDRDGSFEPQIVRKRQRRFVGFDDKILALYSRGLSTRDIAAHLEEIYGVSRRW